MTYPFPHQLGKITGVGYSGSLSIIWQPDADFIVAHPFAVRVFTDHSHKITVPRGFLTDLTSIPPILWSTGIGKTGKHMGAAVVHDYLYQFLEGSKARRKWADKMFFALMIKDGVPQQTAGGMYAAVRMFGKPAKGNRFLKPDDPRLHRGD